MPTTLVVGDSTLSAAGAAVAAAAVEEAARNDGPRRYAAGGGEKMRAAGGEKMRPASPRLSIFVGSAAIAPCWRTEGKSRKRGRDTQTCKHIPR